MIYIDAIYTHKYRNACGNVWLRTEMSERTNRKKKNRFSYLFNWRSWTQKKTRRDTTVIIRIMLSRRFARYGNKRSRVESLCRTVVCAGLSAILDPCKPSATVTAKVSWCLKLKWYYRPRTVRQGHGEGGGLRNGSRRLNDPRGKFHGRTDSRPLGPLVLADAQLKDNRDQ